MNLSTNTQLIIHAEKRKLCLLRRKKTIGAVKNVVYGLLDKYILYIIVTCLLIHTLQVNIGNYCFT
jgi:hypothetical protein